MSLQRGFTLIETLVGLLILAFVLTTSLAVFVERQRRLRDPDEMIAVYQALANEAEVSRTIPYASLKPATTTFRSDTSILAGLQGVRASVTISPWKQNTKLIEMTIEWNDGARSSSMSIVRANTGRGGSFW